MSRHSVETLTFYTGSTFGNNKEYTEGVAELAHHIALNNIRLVYGGGKVGLMGMLADTALAAGGEVIGIMPEKLVEDELSHDGITDLEVVETMHDRKARMAELGDAFIVLPGGAGTLEEFFEMWTWQQIGIHTKPVALYNINGFWDKLFELIEHLAAEGFLRAEYIDSLIVANTPESLLEQIKMWEPRPPKWDLMNADDNINY